MYCIQCGAKNEEGTKFCVYCGVPMQIEANHNSGAGCTAVEPAAQPEPCRCPGCGEPAEPGVNFCIRCGSSLHSAAQRVPADKPESTGMDLLLCIPVLLSAVSIFLLCKFQTRHWFIFSADTSFLLVFVTVSLVVPLLCLWAGVNKNKKRIICRTAQVFAVLDMLLPLALLGLMFIEEPHLLPGNLPYMVLYLSRSVAAILVLSRHLKKTQ